MLPKPNRLTKDDDFSRVFKRGKSSWGKGIGIRALKTNSPISRFGFMVSNKVSKKATVRNKIKRQLRAVVKLNWDQLSPGYDVVILTSPKVVELSYQKIKTELENCFSKAKLIKK